MRHRQAWILDIEMFALDTCIYKPPSYYMLSIIKIPAQGLRKVYVKKSRAQGLHKVAQGISRCAQGKTCSRKRARLRKDFPEARKALPIRIGIARCMRKDFLEASKVAQA